MRIVPAIESKIRREIRDAKARDPLVSIVDLQAQLETKLNHTFSRAYLTRLARKVERQSLVDLDRTKIDQRINFSRENYRLMRERLLKIIMWEPGEGASRPPSNKDVIEAIKNLVMMDLALLNAELAAGMYRTPQEAAGQLRYAPMPVEKRQVVIAAFINWGMLPPEQVEAIIGPALPALNGTTATTPH